MLPAELKGGAQDINDQFNYPISTIAKMRVELQMHILDCYEIIYWPFAVNLISGHVKNDSTCVSFASKALAICIDRINKSQTRYRQRQYGSWLILRRSTRSALLLLAANLTPELRQILPPQWKSSVFIVIEMLRYWGEELPDASHRLTILESLLRNIETDSTATATEIWSSFWFPKARSLVARWLISFLELPPSRRSGPQRTKSTLLLRSSILSPWLGS